MANSWDSILDEAEELTNAQLDSQIANLTSLKTADIARVAPTREDREKLIELLALVSNSKMRNESKAQALQKSAVLAGLAVKLIGVLA